MVAVELVRIVIDEAKKEQIIVLQEKAGSRLLPIVVGLNEAIAIKMHLSGFTPPRPLTHDLLKRIFDSLTVRLDKVVIDNLVENTFHAKLYLVNKDEEHSVVDARPSDSIALAVRMDSPVFIE